RMQFVPVPGSEFEIPANLVLLAMGFVGPERAGLLESLGVKLTERGNVARDQWWMTNVPGVFTAGDMQRGQSLIVWAIAEGRSAARAIDEYLMGESQLPAPFASSFGPSDSFGSLGPFCSSSIRSRKWASLRNAIQFNQLAGLVAIGRNTRS